MKPLRKFRGGFSFEYLHSRTNLLECTHDNQSP